MTKEELEKRNKKLIEALFNVDNGIVIAAIEEIQNAGNADFLYPLLQLLKRNDNQKVERKVKAVFFDLKTNTAVPYIIDAIKSEESSIIRQFLVTSCWNNGLDYSEHLELFVDLFINENFEIAFDAFTVIENMIGFAENEVINKQIDKLKHSSGKISQDKRQLLIDLIQILEDKL
jgi:hypothetical protein